MKYLNVWVSSFNSVNDWTSLKDPDPFGEKYTSQIKSTLLRSSLNQIIIYSKLLLFTHLNGPLLSLLFKF